MANVSITNMKRSVIIDAAKVRLQGTDRYLFFIFKDRTESMGTWLENITIKNPFGNALTINNTDQYIFIDDDGIIQKMNSENAIEYITNFLERCSECT
jgi:hypothetical protein